MSPIVIRVSALSGYPDCPRRSAARLFRREIVDAGFRLRYTLRGIGAAIGTAVHKSAATVLGEKARSGSLPPVSVAFDAAIDTLREQIVDSREIEFDGPRGATHNQREAELQTIAMSSAYHREIAPQVEPILVEEHLEAEVEGSIVLTGHPDVVAREPHAVRDLKTGRRMASNAPQLGGYSLLARSCGLDIDAASIDFIQRVSINKPQPDPVTTRVAIESAETAASNILRTIARDLDVFRNGDPERRILPGDPWAFMANPSSVLCAAKWCPAYGTEFCREGDVGK